MINHRKKNKRNNKTSTTLQTNKTTTTNKLKNHKKEKMSKSIKFKSSSVDCKKGPSTRKHHNLLGADSVMLRHATRNIQKGKIFQRKIITLQVKMDNRQLKLIQCAILRMSCIPEISQPCCKRIFLKKE